MSAIQVKSVPEDIHAKLRERAARRGRSLSAYVLEIIERDVARPATREWLDELERDPVTDVSSEEILRALDEAREEREQEILAAVSDRH